MRGFKWIGTATNNKTGQYYVMYGRKGIVSLYETDKEDCFIKLEYWKISIS